MLALLLAAAAAWVTLRPGAGQAQSTAPPPDVTQFRIAVGLLDASAKPWAGRLTVENGELVRIQGWRFSQGDRVNQDGTFSFQTKVANFENQLSAAREYGQTDWNDPNLKRHIPEGVTVQVRGESARIVFTSESGSFSFLAAEVSYDRPAMLLDGNAMVERLPVETRL